MWSASNFQFAARWWTLHCKAAEDKQERRVKDSAALEKLVLTLPSRLSLAGGLEVLVAVKPSLEWLLCA